MIKQGLIDESLEKVTELYNAFNIINRCRFRLVEERDELQRKYDLLKSQVDAPTTHLIREVTSANEKVKERNDLLDYFSAAYYMGCNHTMKCAIDEHNELRKKVKEEEKIIC